MCVALSFKSCLVFGCIDQIDRLVRIKVGRNTYAANTYGAHCCRGDAHISPGVSSLRSLLAARNRRRIRYKIIVNVFHCGQDLAVH